MWLIAALSSSFEFEFLLNSVLQLGKFSNDM